MYIVIIQSVPNGASDNPRTEVSLSGPKDIIDFMWILESATRVNAYKIIDSDCGVVADLYKAFGHAAMPKHVTEFKWQKK